MLSKREKVFWLDGLREQNIEKMFLYKEAFRCQVIVVLLKDIIRSLEKIKL